MQKLAQLRGLPTESLADLLLMQHIHMIRFEVEK